MFEAYLDAPASVPDEWRELFEGDPGAFAGSLPGLAELLRQERQNGDPAAAAEPAAATTAAPPRQPATAALIPAPPPSPPAAPVEASPGGAPPVAVDETLLGGVAAAMALVKAYRMHGHLAARLDPLGSEPMGTRHSMSRGSCPR